MYQPPVLCVQLLSPSNVAVYGGMCALATFDRQELQKNVISSRCVSAQTPVYLLYNWCVFFM